MFKTLICVQVILALAAAGQTPAHKTRYLYGGGLMDWVDSDHSDADNLNRYF
jgi:hypothetical protein